ncbi:MAG: leucine-rich repeat domain-containing protein [Muribaculaceae bacterium]|nr:leucine-rich repeat domain-containing protein [Muribaculaceae bacterium]
MNRYLLISLIAASSLTASAEIRQGLKQYVEQDGLRYELLDLDSRLAAVAGPAAVSEDFAMIPAEVSVTGTFFDLGQSLEFTNEPFTVVQINPKAFLSNTELYYVTFPPTLTDIGESAFQNCTILTVDSLPESLETIGNLAFSACNAITKLTLPASVKEIGEKAFAYMTSLERVVMAESRIEEIPSYAFAECPQLEQVYLPFGVKTIADHAFYKDYALEDIILPEGLEHIGSYAFEGSAADDRGLKSVTFPSTLKSLDKYAFRFAPLVSAFMDKATQLEEIQDYTFEHCYSLKELSFPDNIKRIGAHAFDYCARNASRHMSALELPAALSELSANAFVDSYIISVKVGDNVTSLPAYSLGIPQMVELGSGLKDIDINAFSFDNLRMIRIHAATPPSLSADVPLTEMQMQQITVVVDDGCKNLYEKHPRWKNFNLIEESASTVSVHLDGSMPLASAIYLQSGGTLPSRVTSLTVTGHLTDDDFEIIRQNMFSLTALDISGTDNTVIPAKTFQNFTLLSVMKLPEGLTSIGDYAFQGCNSMRLETLPDGIETIGQYAFKDCYAITVSHLPRALRTIGYQGFSSCTSIKEIIAYENLLDFGQAAFSSCDLLEYVDLSRTKITQLKANALYICNLQTLLLPSTIETINYRAIAINPIRTLELPGAVRKIEEEAFYKTGLRAVSFGEGLTEIYESTLENCPRLVSVSFPSTLKNVGSNILNNSPKVSAISCRATEAPATASGAFNGILTQKCTLTVPAAGFFSYLNAPQWGAFGKLEVSLDVTMPDDVDVTVLPEEEYQEIMEEERLDELAEEYSTPGLDEDDYDEDSADEDSDEPVAARRRAARAVRTSRNALSTGKYFASLFNGASLNTPGTGRGNRIFLNLKPEDELEAILVNGNDITDLLDENNSLLLPADAAGALEIRMVSNVNTSVAAVTIAADEYVDAYDISGICVYSGARDAFRPNSGFYVLRARSGATVKITVK